MKTRANSQRICLLTCEDLVNHPDGRLAADDDHLVRELKARGHTVDLIAWNHYRPAERRDDVVLVRTTWDYVRRCDEFLKKIAEIHAHGICLYNPESILRWNAHKSYLAELAAQGVPVVDTKLFRPGDSLSETEMAIRGWNTQEWIFKPAISATSYGLIRVKRYELSAALLQVQASGQDHLIQPFMPDVLSGEISLHFFGKVFSHAVVKRPAAGDFRVQEAYGGKWAAHSPTAAEVGFCGEVLRRIPDPLLVARVDFIHTGEGPRLMELELIEPMLFFGSAPEHAARNFVDALEQYQGDTP